MNNLLIIVTILPFIIFMDTAWARFSTADTWSGIQTQPISLNKYTYANANPLMYNDPSGRMSLLQVSAGTSGIGILASLSTSQYSPFNGSSVGQTAPSLDLGERSDIGDVIEACFKEHYNMGGQTIRIIVGVGAIPIYKPAVKMRVIGNASKFTNFISAFGHWNFRNANLTFRLLGTNRIAGIAGRANLATAAGIGSYDLTSISLCVNHHL